MTTIDLWNGNAPYGGGGVEMHCYEPDNNKGDGAVIIFSGGGYSHRAYHEAEPYALELNRMGLLAFVVDYRVAPAEYPAPLLDAHKAIQAVRSKAKEYGIDPNKIAVMGSSAGGHLASLASTLCHSDFAENMPNAQILCYPVTDIRSHQGSYENLLGGQIEKHNNYNPILLANENTPPAFIWHTSSDDAVDVKGTYRYATRLSELGVPVEMHIYPVGTHGLGLATGDPKRAPVEYVQRWIEDLERWLRLIGFINP